MEYMHRAQPPGYLVAALTSFVLLGAASAQELVSAETVAAIQEELLTEKIGVQAISHPDSIYAGAIGAALWGAYRHHKLIELEQRAAA